MLKETDEAPHSVVFWLKWEIHERGSNGQIEAHPKDSKEFRGALHCKDRDEAKIIIGEVIENLKKELFACQKNLSQPA